MSAAWPWVADALVVVGLVTVTVAVIGILRLPDLLSRLQASSKAVILGTIPILLAVAFEGKELTPRAILLALFLLFTGPIATFAIAQAAHRRGKRPAGPGTERQGR